MDILVQYTLITDIVKKERHDKHKEKERNPVNRYRRHITTNPHHYHS